jgi:hypothetical protein
MIVVKFSRYNSLKNSIPVLVPHINRTRNTVPILELEKRIPILLFELVLVLEPVPKIRTNFSSAFTNRNQYQLF